MAFYHPQLGATGPWVPQLLFRRRLDRPRRDYLEIESRIRPRFGPFRTIDPFLRNFAKIMFYDPVLERVERDHGQPASGFDPSDQGRQCLFQDPKLVVDRNPQPLKYPRRRMPRSPAWNDFFHGFGQIRRRLKKSFRSLPDYMGGNPAGSRFLSQPPEDVDQLLLRRKIHQFGSA